MHQAYISQLVEDIELIIKGALDTFHTNTTCSRDDKGKSELKIVRKNLVDFDMSIDILAVI